MIWNWSSCLCFLSVGISGMHQSTELGMEPRALCVRGECSASGRPTSVLICIIQGWCFSFAHVLCFYKKLEVGRVSGLPLLLACSYVDVDTHSFYIPGTLSFFRSDWEILWHLPCDPQAWEESRVSRICHSIVHGKTNTNLFALNFKYSPYTKGSSVRNCFIVGTQSRATNLSPLGENPREVFLPEQQTSNNIFSCLFHRTGFFYLYLSLFLKCLLNNHRTSSFKYLTPTFDIL